MAGLSSVRGTWVQTERAAHEAWAALIGRQPRAAALLHLLVANMDRSGALLRQAMHLIEHKPELTTADTPESMPVIKLTPWWRKSLFSR
jgi:hypothetical protein